MKRRGARLVDVIKFSLIKFLQVKGFFDYTIFFHLTNMKRILKQY